MIAVLPVFLATKIQRFNYAHGYSLLLLFQFFFDLIAVMSTIKTISAPTLFVVFVLLTLLPMQLFAYDDQYSNWPTDGWDTRSLSEAGFDEGKFDHFLEYILDDQDEKSDRDNSDEEGQEKKKSTFRTNALIIIKDGHLVYERYNYGFTQNNKQPLFSISKSIMGTLVGIAQSRGVLHVNQTVSTYVNIPPILTWQRMMIDDLMRMSSGILWREDYNESPSESNIVQVLYGKDWKSFPGHILALPVVYPPGEFFNYSTGDSFLLSHLLGQAIGSNEALAEFAHDELWTPLGIDNYTIERDQDGNFYGGGHFFLTPRDLAKFGLLQLHQGMWDGQQIYFPEWYDYMTTMAPTWITKSDDENVPGPHGAHWWLNVEIPHLDLPPPYPSAPQNTFFASGHGGQKLIIIPSLRLILVRNGWEQGDDVDTNKMLQLLLECLQ